MSKVSYCVCKLGFMFLPFLTPILVTITELLQTTALLEKKILSFYLSSNLCTIHPLAHTELLKYAHRHELFFLQTFFFQFFSPSLHNHSSPKNVSVNNKRAIIFFHLLGHGPVRRASWLQHKKNARFQPQVYCS